MAAAVVRQRLLAPLTTLGLGGPAAHFVVAETRAQIVEALAFAKAQALPVRVLGGGSNLIVPDAGVAGLVLQIATRGVVFEREHDDVLITAQAGEPWDALVARAVDAELYGIECLTGIPGLVGATPIQNVGAYGQEVAQVIDAVEVLERDTIRWLPAHACGFGYRDSRFRRAPEDVIVLAVRFRLATRGVPALRYPELAQAVAARTDTPTLQDVLATVRALRAGKGMLVAPGSEPSAGSFFTNPIVDASEAAEVATRAHARRVVSETLDLPRFAQPGGRVKLSAGWLIERAGFAKGLTRGPVGISSKHALALVHRGGGTTCDLMALASEIQQGVRSVFGVSLAIEPVRW